MAELKISDIDVDEVLDYIRVSPLDVERNQIEQLMTIAASYIESETGKGADDEPEFVEVFYLLIAHMYDHRTMTIDKDVINPIVTSILGHHRRNFLA